MYITTCLTALMTHLTRSSSRLSPHCFIPLFRWDKCQQGFWNIIDLVLKLSLFHFIASTKPNYYRVFTESLIYLYIIVFFSHICQLFISVTHLIWCCLLRGALVKHHCRVWKLKYKNWLSEFRKTITKTGHLKESISYF